MNTLGFRLRIFLIVFLAILLIGTFGFMAIEKASFIDSVYFSIVTLATVGYGDIHPQTNAGKIFVVLLVITGVGAFLGVVASATELMLNKRERQMRREKLNMVIGAFFSEVGSKLLTILSEAVCDLENFRNNFVIKSDWLQKDFLIAQKYAAQEDYALEIKKIRLDTLYELLSAKRNFLLQLIENPALLEHESFTDLLLTVFHLADELNYRIKLSDLPDSDRAHLANDAKRVYKLLLGQWLFYMSYLKDRYPYLFSLALRANFFDRNASIVIN